MFVFYPLSDDNPTTRTPILTWALIGINVLIFLYQFSIGDAANNRLISDYGVRPSVFTDFNDLHTIITSAFLHADIWHLFFNMLFLYIYGDNIEAYLGRVNFMIFYALGGLSAALLQSMFSGGMDVPMIGASGCISAIMGAYWVLYPKAKINVFLWIFIWASSRGIYCNSLWGKVCVWNWCIMYSYFNTSCTTRNHMEFERRRVHFTCLDINYIAYFNGRF